LTVLARQQVSATSEHTHSGTHTGLWIDAVGTPIGVQQKLMRHSDVRTTMNIYGDAASADMREAHGKIAQMALQG
jgi:integrase